MVKISRFMPGIRAFFIFMLAFAYISVFIPQPAQASTWYNSAWTYRKAFTVTGSTAGAQTNYQIRLTIGYAAGADSGATVYLDSKSQVDFDDLRFTASDGITLLDSWLETKTDSNSAVIWVELDSIPASPATAIFYMYYGNSTITSNWSLANTFIRDISGCVRAYLINENTGTNTADTSGGSYTAAGVNTPTWTTGKFDYAMNFVAGSSQRLQFNDVGMANPFTWEIWYKTATTGTKMGLIYDGVIGAFQFMDLTVETTNKMGYWYGGAVQSTTSNVTNGLWKHGVFTVTAGHYELFLNSVKEHEEDTGALALVATGLAYIGDSAGGNYFTGQIDEVRIYNRALTQAEINDLYNNRAYTTTNYAGHVLIRKLANPEPTITAWATAEVVPTPLVIQNVKIFTDYKEIGDWLIAIRYINTYSPYYDTYDIKKYFVAQLVNGSTVVAQTPITAWGNKVGNIYLNTAQVSGLTYGSAYKIRIYGTFSGNPYTEYTLLSTDWLGTDLAQLDSWVITSASTISSYYGSTLTTYIADRGEVLNATGGSYFSTGISGLSTVRPQLFQIYTVPSSYIPNITPQTYRQSLQNWQVAWGPDGTAMLNGIASWLGVDGGFIGAMFFVIMMVACALIAFPAGHTTAANILSIGFLGIGIYFGLDIIWLILIGLFAAFLLFKNQFMDK